MKFFTICSFICCFHDATVNKKNAEDRTAFKFILCRMYLEKNSLFLTVKVLSCEKKSWSTSGVYNFFFLKIGTAQFCIPFLQILLVSSQDTYLQTSLCSKKVKIVIHNVWLTFLVLLTFAVNHALSRNLSCHGIVKKKMQLNRLKMFIVTIDVGSLHKGHHSVAKMLTFGI